MRTGAAILPRRLRRPREGRRHHESFRRWTYGLPAVRDRIGPSSSEEGGALRFRSRLRLFAVAAAGAAWLGGLAQADVPKELYDALGLAQDASPSVLYDALVKRYRDPAQGYSEGKFSDLWEPTAFERYLNPMQYQPRDDLDFEVTREDCVTCHEGITPGWVHSWEGSAHARIEEIRALPDDDSRAYKKAMIADVEANLRDMGLLAADQPLAEVACADCHIGVGAADGNHKTDLRLPDGAVCGQCHVRQFAERESERDTLTWPQDQWPAGRPSHALSMIANYETGIWAGMAEREVADGCTQCHTTQATCSECHSRHEFSAAQARQPETCSTCHNGVDHNEFENYMLSTHGVIYQTRGKGSWDFERPLEQAFTEAGYTAPTCQTCHAEFNGQYGHNFVRKVRWGFAPMPSIAENLDHPWFADRKEAWVSTCSQCHAGGFARAYLDNIDKATTDGVDLVEQARAVMQKLYDDQLLVGQVSNRPAPPAPDTDAPGGFFGLFWTEGNNPTALDHEFAQMWEQRLMRHFKGVAHANPGGYTYSFGWSELIGALARIRDGDTQLREKAALEARLRALEEAAQ